MQTFYKFFILLLLTGFTCFGQEKKNTIKTNVLGYFVNYVNGSYERVIKDTYSLNGTIGYWRENFYNVNAWLFELEARKYFGGGTTLDNFYAALGSNYIFGEGLQIEMLNVESDIDTYSVGVFIKLGKQWLLGKSKDWVIDLNIGYNFSVSDALTIDGKNSSGNQDYNRTLLGFTLGYAF